MLAADVGRRERGEAAQRLALRVDDVPPLGRVGRVRGGGVVRLVQQVALEDGRVGRRRCCGVSFGVGWPGLAGGVGQAFAAWQRAAAGRARRCGAGPPPLLQQHGTAGRSAQSSPCAAPVTQTPASCAGGRRRRRRRLRCRCRALRCGGALPLPHPSQCVRTDPSLPLRAVRGPSRGPARLAAHLGTPHSAPAAERSAAARQEPPYRPEKRSGAARGGVRGVGAVGRGQRPAPLRPRRRPDSPTAARLSPRSLTAAEERRSAAGRATCARACSMAAAVVGLCAGALLPPVAVSTLRVNASWGRSGKADGGGRANGPSLWWAGGRPRDCRRPAAAEARAPSAPAHCSRGIAVVAKAEAPGIRRAWQRAQQQRWRPSAAAGQVRALRGSFSL